MGKHIAPSACDITACKQIAKKKRHTKSGERQVHPTASRRLHRHPKNNAIRFRIHTKVPLLRRFGKSRTPTPYPFFAWPYTQRLGRHIVPSRLSSEPACNITASKEKGTSKVANARFTP